MSATPTTRTNAGFCPTCRWCRCCPTPSANRSPCPCPPVGSSPWSRRAASMRGCCARRMRSSTSRRAASSAGSRRPSRSAPPPEAHAPDVPKSPPSGGLFLWPPAIGGRRELEHHQDCALQNRIVVVRDEIEPHRSIGAPNRCDALEIIHGERQLELGQLLTLQMSARPNVRPAELNQPRPPP